MSILFSPTINILASCILFHTNLFFEDDNFGHNNMAYDEGRDENLRDVVADINENLELQAVGNGDALQPMRISMTI